MATYKVIQDIEAEDKFLGPLTLKQFVFAAISAVFLYISFILFTRGVAFLLVMTLPPALLGAFLAVPWSKDQPTEVWVLAKLRFYLKPKKRIWDQSGVKELVTITVPKKIEKHLTKEFDQTEVRSRLKALADTIDSRGWAVKNSSLGAAYAPVNFVSTSDRLVDPDALSAAVPDFDVSKVGDIMDRADNPLSDDLDQMIQTSAQARRDEALDRMERIRRGESLEAIDQPPVQVPTPARPIISSPVVQSTQADNSGSNEASEQEINNLLKKQIHAGDEVYDNLRVLKTDEIQADTGTHESKTAPSQSTSIMTTPVAPDILDLARNDDLNVETIARQASKVAQRQDVASDDSEVVVSLH